jgi:hypothetical protein
MTNITFVGSLFLEQFKSLQNQAKNDCRDSKF